MPITYWCNNCNLAFTVGWFHYHTFDTGYGSCSLFACGKCGNQYAIENPTAESGKTERFLYRKKPHYSDTGIGPSLDFNDGWEGGEEIKVKESNFQCKLCGEGGPILWKPKFLKKFR